MVRQEAHLVAEVPDYLVEILARFTRNLRESSSVDQRSGVSARFAIAGAETIAAAALHRATLQGEAEAVARVVDLETAVDVLGGKIEFETGEEGREQEILTHLLRTATAETVRAHFRGLDFGLLVEAIEEGALVTTGEQVTARDFLTGLPVLGESELYDDVCDRLDADNDGERAGAIELALEGLYLARKIGKDTDGSETVYGCCPLWESPVHLGYRHLSGEDRPISAGFPVPQTPEEDAMRRTHPLPPLRRRRPAGAAGGHRRGAGRDRRGRDGGVQPRAGDARVPAPRRSQPDRPRRPGPPGGRAAPRPAAAAQPRRDPRRGARAARPGRARGAQAAGSRRDDGRHRPGVPRDAARSIPSRPTPPLP